MTNEIRHGISRDHLAQLVAELRQIRTQREASSMISAAGLVGDSWLIQCLMYESDAAIWVAWNMPEAQ